MSWRDEYEALSRPRRSLYHGVGLDDDLDRLDKIGGPAQIAPVTSEIMFDRACSEFRELEILEILMEYTADLTTARRHWPWIALAALGYRFNQEFDRPADDPAPSDVTEVLGQLRQDSSRLLANLEKFASWHQKPREFAHATKRGHLEYLDSILAQHVAGWGKAGTPHDVDAVALFNERLKFLNWQHGLSCLIEGIREAQGMQDNSLLVSPIRVTIAGLHQLVKQLALIWQSMTGKTPSANRVHRRGGDSIPDFVRMVSEVASLANCHVPTASQVKSALAHID